MQLIVDRAPLIVSVIVRLRIAKEEPDVRQTVKQAGDRWDATAAMWRLPLGAARRLGLASRVVREGGE